MIDFIDKTSIKNGTPLNRSNMMALQDFESKTTSFNSDGTITEENDQGQVLTISFNADGSITYVFEGEKTITKNIIFKSNGDIEEIVGNEEEPE